MTAYEKLEKAFTTPAPVKLSPAEAAAIYKVLRNEGVTPECIENRAAGIIETRPSND